MDNLIRVAVADDHPVIRMGIETTLDSMSNVRRIGSVRDSTQLVTLLDAHPCEILVTDYAMPGGHYGDGLELISFLRNRYQDMNIIVLTGLGKMVLIRSLMAFGVYAILSKTDDISHLSAAIQAAQVGRRYFSPSIASMMKSQPLGSSSIQLSPREAEVIALFIGGASINGIAEKLQRSKQTISTQKVNAMRKLGLDSDADLFKYAIELDLYKKNNSRPFPSRK